MSSTYKPDVHATVAGSLLGATSNVLGRLATLLDNHGSELPTPVRQELEETYAYLFRTHQRNENRVTENRRAILAEYMS